MAISRKEYNALTMDERITMRKALLRKTYIHGYAELAIVTELNINTLRDYRWSGKYAIPDPIPGRTVRYPVWTRKSIERWMENRGFIHQNNDHAEATA